MAVTMGRPSTFTQETADAICARLAEGESLNSICKDEAFPPESTVRRWALDDEQGFSANYARAREVGYLRMADEITQIADNGSNDTYTDDEGNERTNQDVIARSRLRVDTRKWLLSKMLPKVYGDKLELSGDPDKPLALVIASPHDEKL